MGTGSRCRAIVVAGVLAWGGAHAIGVYARGQAQTPGLPTEITQIRFNSGQSVVPYFEGWIRNPDGTFDMVFGYFNRNWKEELAIPAGPDNRVWRASEARRATVRGGGAPRAENEVEPNGPDSGQPTYFLPRRQRFVFRVRVPADFGNKEVVWTIRSNGRTETGFGNLLPEQEITERVVMTSGNFNPGRGDPNTPPSITIAPVQSVSAGTSVTLAASVVDDGLPKPRPARAPRPTTEARGGQVNFGAQVNSSGPARPRGLTVNWLQYRGPAKVSFEPSGPIPVANGQAVARARFATPGVYKLIATASDGALSKRTELTINVQGRTSSSPSHP